jgi:hypothetical protein
MDRLLSKLGLISSSLALLILMGTSAYALPAVASNNGAAQQAQAKAQQARTTALQKMCVAREKAIDQIITRIDTRAKNQNTLFSTIATRVEAFYASKGKSLSNYDQLVAAVNAAESKTLSDFTSLQANSNFNCSASDPRALVLSFQNDLKLEISDLQSLRTSVKNLIVGVAQANGATLTGTSTTTGSAK